MIDVLQTNIDVPFPKIHLAKQDIDVLPKNIDVPFRQIDFVEQNSDDVSRNIDLPAKNIDMRIVMVVIGDGEEGKSHRFCPIPAQASIVVAGKERSTMTTQPVTTEAPQWKPSDVIAAVRAMPMSSAEYAELILAIKQSIPDLDPPDKSLQTKLSWARRVSPNL